MFFELCTVLHLSLYFSIFFLLLNNLMHILMNFTFYQLKQNHEQLKDATEAIGKLEKGMSSAET